MNKMIKTILAACALAAALPGSAADGMWTLDNLPLAALQSRHGFSPDAAFVSKLMRGSVRLSNGCSGSFVSADALVMTNHHCISECLQQLSTAQLDRLAGGVLARQREQELRCPEIELDRLEAITDVTARVQQATAGLDGAAFTAAQDAARAQITQECRAAHPATARCELVTLYQGGRYHLYRYFRFDDVRLVWAPEEAIAAFGGDPDNFNFPRYVLDAAFLRAYEGGKPAKGVEHFRFNHAGAEPADLTLVTGHPGTTNRQYTAAQLESLRNRLALDLLPYLSELRGVLLQFSRQGAEQQRLAANDLLGIENGIKVVRGELAALSEPAVMAAKRDAERSLQAFVAADPALQREAGGAWDAIAAAQAVAAQIRAEHRLLERGSAFSSDYFRHARTLVRGAAERLKPDARRLREFSDNELPQVERRLRSPAPIDAVFEQMKLGWSLGHWRATMGPDDPLVKRVLEKLSPDDFAKWAMVGTKLGDPAERMRLWQGGMAAIEASRDPFIRLALEVDPAARALRQRMESEVQAVERKQQERIAAARFRQSGTGVYPDATFTLRLSDGVVRGWDERGRAVLPYTDIGGAFTRATGSAPFALPPSWLAASGKVNKAQRFNFVSTNDITGGNSGSPVLNRNAEVVGLAFDGNVHSIGGAFAFDERVNRTIAVHSGVIVEALGSVYDAAFLVDELLGGQAR